MISNWILQSLSSQFDPIPNNVVVVPVITDTASFSYLHLLGVGGDILATVKMPSKPTTYPNNGRILYHRYEDNLYVFYGAAQTFFRINLTSFSVSSLNTATNSINSFTWWVRVANNKLLHIDIYNQSYHVLDMATGVITRTTGYTGGTAWSSIIGSHGVCSFYNRSSSGLDSFGNKVYWTAAKESSGMYNAEISAATYSSGTLSTRTIVVPEAGNYSRRWGATGDSSTGVISYFGNGSFYKVLNSTNSATQWSTATTTVTYSGNSYTIINDGADMPILLNSNLRMYLMAVYYDGSTRYGVLASFDFSQPTNTQSPVFVYNFGLDGPNQNIKHMFKVGDDNVILITQDRTSLNTLKLVNITGTTVNSVVNVTLSTTHCDRLAGNVSEAGSELGVYLT